MTRVFQQVNGAEWNYWNSAAGTQSMGITTSELRSGASQICVEQGYRPPTSCVNVTVGSRTPAAPAPSVTGGGTTNSGGGSRSRTITAPSSDITVGASGATSVRWSGGPGDSNSRVLLRRNGAEHFYRFVPAGTTSFLLGHANVTPGASELCVATGADEPIECVEIRKVTSTAPRFSAFVSSARLSGSKIMLNGQVASTTKTIKAQVRVSDGKGHSAKSRVQTVRMAGYPGSGSFTTRISWPAGTPRTLVVTTTVWAGNVKRSFKSTLR